MATRTIQYPGVEITERNVSTISPSIVGTGVLVQGFASKGTPYQVIQPTTISDLETNFGRPENEAERYFYSACKEVINEGGNLHAIKLPYDNTMDGNYKYIGLDIGTSEDISTFPTSGLIDSLSANAPSLSGFTEITVSSVSEISQTDYDTLVAGGNFTSSNEFIIVNDLKTKKTGTLENEGIFVAVVDAFDGMLYQRVISETDSDAMQIVYDTATTYSYAVPLTGAYNATSTSEELMAYYPTIEFTSDGDDIDTYRMGHLTVIVCKTAVDPNNDDKLTVTFLEVFTGSLDKTEKDPSTTQSIYLGDVINSNSNYIKFYATNVSTTTTIDSGSAYYVAPVEVDLMDFNAAESIKRIVGTSIPTYLTTSFEKVANINEYQLDVVTDAGLSTIADFATSGLFDPVNDTDSNIDIDSSTDVANWRNVCNSLINFCQNTRKDCMAILDVPRNLAVRGSEKQIRKTNPTNTFSNTITPSLKYLTGLNSNYAAIYSTWGKQTDSFNGVSFWVPSSVQATGIYCRNDRIGNIWDAPFGLNRGIINTITDIAFNPVDKEESQLYTKSFNYTKNYVTDGFVLMGQKTTQVKPSAFDRVNVRRLFLRLERLVYQIARYYVGEPNNTFTRRRLVDSITPIFENIKQQGGMYDYRIICDQTNNTPTVIDANELKVGIYIQPVRTAEFIRVEFVAVPTGASFTEYV